MPRLVRKTPLIERIKARLDPYDLLLWLSEEFNDDTYDEWLVLWGTPIGIGLNIIFILARGASRPGASRSADDVFGDDGSRGGSGWFSWLTAFLIQCLTLLSVLNALFTVFRKRHYRLFEQDIEVPPTTPSARRVRVDSSPISSSPLRYLQNVISSYTAPARAYPDAEREVWEVSVWDPKPFNLSIFTMFSPGHLLIYYLLLPPTTMDPRPSVTVVKAIAFSVLLSVQLGLLKSSFLQQAQDSALIHGQVMNEYDTKFVHPNLFRPVRDVGIQTRVTGTTPRTSKTREVDVYTPTAHIKRAFETHPNTNYAREYDPDNLTATRPESRRNSGIFGSINTLDVDTPPNYYKIPSTQPYRSSTAATASLSSPMKPHHERLRERTPMKGDGGSLGVYSHAASPLRKAASSNQLGSRREELQRSAANSLKRVSTPGSVTADALDPGRRRVTGRF